MKMVEHESVSYFTSKLKASYKRDIYKQVGRWSKVLGIYGVYTEDYIFL